MRIDRPFQRLLNVFILLFLVVSGTMVYWQVTQAPSLKALAYNPRHCVADTVPQRGTIYDRNGIQLAWSVKDATAPCGWRRHYADASLAPVIGYYDPQGFGETGLEAKYEDILSGSASSPAQTISAGIDDALRQAEHLKTFGNNIYLTIDERIQKVASNAYNPTQQYCGTSIDSHSQRGSILVEDPHTGEMLAMVSHPGFDNDRLVDHSTATDGAVANDGTPLTVGEEYWNQLLNDPNKPLINRPVSDLLVPGSSFKTLTLIAALDSGAYKPRSTFNQADSLDYVVDGFDISTNNLDSYASQPASRQFPMDIIHQFAYSNNVAFARIATTVGTQKWLEYAHQFGISYGDNLTSIDFDLDVKHSYVYRPTIPFDQVALANAGYGQATLQITPLQMSVIVSAVAADGAYYSPHLLLKSVPYGIDANSVAKNDPHLVGNTMSPQTAQGVRQAMRAVVDYGSVGASGGPIGAMRDSATLVGGKTGTGQVANGQNSEAWFVSLAPDDVSKDGTVNSSIQPKLAIVVQKEEGGEGACQAPIVNTIYQQALPLVGYPLG